MDNVEYKLNGTYEKYQKKGFWNRTTNVIKKIARYSLIATTLAITIATAVGCDSSGCEYDSQCKNDRVCYYGNCVTPDEANGKSKGNNNLDDIFEVIEDTGCTPKPCFIDEDGDGYGTIQLMAAMCSCSAGFVDNADDCNDYNPNAYPGGPQDCNGVGDVKSLTDVVSSDSKGYDSVSIDTTYLPADFDECFFALQELEKCKEDNPPYIIDVCKNTVSGNEGGLYNDLVQCINDYNCFDGDTPNYISCVYWNCLEERLWCLAGVTEYGDFGCGMMLMCYGSDGFGFGEEYGDKTSDLCIKMGDQTAKQKLIDLIVCGFEFCGESYNIECYNELGFCNEELQACQYD